MYTYTFACASESRCPPILEVLAAPPMGTVINYIPMNPISPQMSHDIGIRFLDLFQDNKNLGKDALKFAKNFQMAVTHNDVITVGTKEDYLSIGQILGLYGQTIKDFESTEKALEAVRHLCALNRQQHCYDEKPEQVDDKFLIFSKFFFVIGQGKTCLHTSDVQQKLQQDVDLKNLQQLEEAKLFMEGMGFKDEADKSSVQLENVKAGEAKKLVELLKCPYLDWTILEEWLS